MSGPGSASWRIKRPNTTQQRHNPNPIQWYWRALITDMNEWVKDGKEPPPSTYPKIADKTLEWKTIVEQP